MGSEGLQQTRLLEVIEQLEPIAMKYQAEEEKKALAKCCVVS